MDIKVMEYALKSPGAKALQRRQSIFISLSHLSASKSKSLRLSWGLPFSQIPRLCYTDTPRPAIH